MGLFDWWGKGDDYVGGSIPDPEEDYSDVFSKLWEPTKWFFDESILKPAADAYRGLPDIVKQASGAIPGVGAAQGISGLGALVGAGIDKPETESVLDIPGIENILREESLEGPAAALEQVAPVDIATLGLGLGAKGVSTIPRLAKTVGAISKGANALDASEGVYGGLLASEALAEGDLVKAGMGAFRMAMGGMGAASSLMPDMTPTKGVTSEMPASETVDEFPDLKLQEAIGAPREEITDLVSTPEEINFGESFRNEAQTLVDEITPEAERVLGMSPEFGGEGIGRIEVQLDPLESGGGAYFVRSTDPETPHTIYLNPLVMQGRTADQVAQTILHEITHRRTPEHEFGVPKLDEEGTNVFPINDEQVAEASSALAEHIRPTMEERGKFVPAEYNIVGDEQALFNNPEIQERLASFRDRIRDLKYEVNPPPPTYEENLKAIQEGRPFPGEEAAAPREGLSSAEQIEYNAIKSYYDQQNAKVQEAGQRFQSAKGEVERKAASKEFQDAKAERDRFKARLDQLEKIAPVKAKPTADELIEMAKKEAAERKVEPSPRQAEVDKAHEKMLEEVTEGVTSEKVISTPANTLRKVLSNLGMTRFNVHSLTRELRAKGLDVPDEFNSQLPELMKELKDRGWVNEKLGGTYTLLAAPGKSIEGIKGKGKQLEVSNIKEGLKESIAATKKPTPEVTLEVTPTIEAKPKVTPTPEVRPGQLHYDENGRRWDIRKIEGDQVTIVTGKGGGERTQVIDKSEVLARRGKIGAPTEGETPEDIDISLEGLPEKSISLADQMKAKLTPDEIKAIGNLFGTTKKKGTADIPEEVRLAQQAAIKARAKGEKVTEGPPSEGVAEPGEGPGRAYKVTLSDGSEHTVKATSPEEAKANAEDILKAGNSTKTVDKVEESLSSLEKAAKYEIEPEKVGREQAAEDIKDTKKAQSEEVKEFSGIVRETERLEKEQFREKKAAESEEVKEITKLSKEEEKLRTAQRKEKFKKQPFLVNLSNGRVVTVNARNAEVAKTIAEQAIKNKGSSLTVASVGKKPTALETAIEGYGKGVEESGFFNNPLVKVLNSMKSLAYGGDVGHMLRQGKQINADLLFSKHWREVPRQIPVVWKSAKSQKFFDDFHKKLYSDKDIAMMVDNFNLDMPGLGKNLKEEAFYGGGLVEKTPILGKFYARPSERAYTAGLNFLRAAETKKLIENLRRRNLTPENAPEKYRAVAKAVNVISQRGDFSPAYQKIFSDASAIYGAPRAKAARLQNAFELFKGGEAGNIVRTTAAKTLAFNAGIFGMLMATTGAEFITDPERSDFGKIRINDKISIDPWMGLGVTARSVAKLVTGKSKSPYTGSTRTVSPSEAVMQEFLGGIAPGVKLAWEALSGKDIRGYQVNKLKSLLNVTPMTAKSVVELLQAAEPEDAFILSLLQIGGEGVDVFDYEKAREEETKLKQERGLPTRSSKKKNRRHFL